MTRREFANPYPDYDGSTVFLNPENYELIDDLKASIDKFLRKRIQKWENDLRALKSDDTSLYTGLSGIALTYHKLWQTYGKDEYLEASTKMADRAMEGLVGRRPASYMCGDVGVFAIGAVIYKSACLEDKYEDCLKRLVTERGPADQPDEILFGRAGYLLALLYVRAVAGDRAVPDRLIHTVVKEILSSGRDLARDHAPAPPPLMYKWHDSCYLGAAHGVAGICHALLLVPEHIIGSELQTDVKGTLDWLLTLQFPSGNFPSSLGSKGGDKLIHWCHGAPGFVHMWCKAYKVFGDERYLEAALRCGETVWNRGILRKGFGICHGTSGNAYTHLALYDLTGEDKHLYRAIMFCDWVENQYNKIGVRKPDRPLSLFEGVAGVIYFMCDVQRPKSAVFPGFI